VRLTPRSPTKYCTNRAAEDIRRGAGSGRLGLQTLINTYPDSEIFGQSQAGHRRFLLQRGRNGEHGPGHPGLQRFHRVLPFPAGSGVRAVAGGERALSADAKPDRDRSEAKAAEEEYQTFLSKYSKDPLRRRRSSGCETCRKSLRKALPIGYFYYLKGDKRPPLAARAIANGTRSTAGR